MSVFFFYTNIKLKNVFPPDGLWFGSDADHYSDVIMGMVESQINRLFKRRSKNTSKVRVTGLCGIHRGPVNFPHKAPVTRKGFPFDDVIMHGLVLCCYMRLHCIFNAVVYGVQ